MGKVTALTAVDGNPNYLGFRDTFQVTWETNSTTPMVIDMSNESAFSVSPDIIPTANQAQIVRLLYPALFPENKFLLTDIDMACVDEQYFSRLMSIPVRNNEISNFSSDAYPGDTRMPICYYFGYGLAFREVTGVTDILSLKSTMIRWWEAGFGWATDEIMFGRLLHLAVEKGRVTLRRYKRGWNKKGIADRRLDRASPDTLKAPTLPIDAHLPRPVEAANEFLSVIQTYKANSLNSGRRYVSFSLWGNLEIYDLGAIANVDDLLDVLPDWQPIFYHPLNYNEALINVLRSKGARTVAVDGGESVRSFWRFLAGDLKDASYVIFRDTDSRVSQRERLMIFEWVLSGKKMHIIRDHPAHAWPIMAGMWGVRRDEGLDFRTLVKRYAQSISNSLDAFEDQRFLATMIYPDLSKDALVHDEFFDNTNNVPARKGLEFVGQRVLASGAPETRHLRELAAWELIKSIAPLNGTLWSRKPLFAKN